MIEPLPSEANFFACLDGQVAILAAEPGAGIADTRIDMVVVQAEIALRKEHC